MFSKKGAPAAIVALQEALPSFRWDQDALRLSHAVKHVWRHSNGRDRLASREQHGLRQWSTGSAPA
jgi:hypothetical protein